MDLIHVGQRSGDHASTERKSCSQQGTQPAARVPLPLPDCHSHAGRDGRPDTLIRPHSLANFRCSHGAAISYVSPTSGSNCSHLIHSALCSIRRIPVGSYLSNSSEEFRIHLWRIQSSWTKNKWNTISRQSSEDGRDALSQCPWNSTQSRGYTSPWTQKQAQQTLSQAGTRKLS